MNTRPAQQDKCGYSVRSSSFFSDPAHISVAQTQEKKRRRMVAGVPTLFSIAFSELAHYEHLLAFALAF